MRMVSRAHVGLVSFLLATVTGTFIAVGCSSEDGASDGDGGTSDPPSNSPERDATASDGSTEDRRGPSDPDAGDSGDIQGSCTPTATRPCVRRVWAGKNTDTLCAVIDKATTSDILECWGDAVSSPLKFDGGTYDGGVDGDGNPILLPIPVAYTPRMFPLEHVRDLTIGGSHACVVEGDGGSLKCWGSNNAGQLGNNTMDPLPSPPETSILDGVDSVDVLSGSTSTAATCARGMDASVLCWGSNSRKQLGLGPDAASRVPVPTLIENFGASKLVASVNGVCSVRSDVEAGTTWCWGAYKAEANGDRQYFQVPTRAAASLSGVRQIARSLVVNDAICALNEAGRVLCWGANDRGQLGDDPANLDRSDIPRDMGLTDVAEVVAGREYFCARLNSGRVKCWGKDAKGQCAVNPNGPDVVTTVDNDRLVVTPTEVAGLSNVIALALGPSSACAVLTDGSLKCWGFAGLIGSELRAGEAIDTPVFVPREVTKWE